MELAGLEAMSIAAADRYAREQVERHRVEMHEWRARRAARLLAEKQASRKTVAEISEECGVHPDVVYRLLRDARAAESP